MDGIWRDLRYALRSMAANPWHTLLVVLTLALAMGANATVFHFLAFLKWQQIPARDPARLVSLWTGDRDPALDAHDWTSFPDYLHYRDDSRVFAGLSAWMVNLASLSSGASAAEWTQVWSVTGNYFAVLGVGTEIGRPITEEDDRPASPRVLVLSDDFWRRRFAADAGVVDRSIRINGHSFTVIGVARHGFSGNWAARRADLWTPMKNIDVLRSPEIDWLHGANLRWLGIIGRLQPGVSVGQAHAAVQAVGDALQRLYPDPKRTRRPAVGAAKMVPPGELERLLPPARILGLSAAMVLIIGCLNASILLLLEASCKQGETAVRMALGARRGTLLRQLFTQHLLISLASCAGGLVLGLIGNHVIGSYVKSYTHHIQFDFRITYFALFLAAGTPLLFSLPAALAVSSPAIMETLRQGREGIPGRSRAVMLRRTLVALELGLALVLAIDSGLLGRSLAKLHNVRLGFQPDNVLLMQVNLAQKSYSPERGGQLFERLLDRVADQPDVVSASLWWLVPFNGIVRDVEVELPGQPERRMAIHYNVVAPKFLDTFKIPLVAGRALDRRDGETAPGAVVINQALAVKLWQGVDPVGRSVMIPQLHRPQAGARFTVVGVAADSQYAEVSNDRPAPLLYVALPQAYKSAMQLAVRTRGVPEAILDRMRQELFRLDPDLALGEVKTLTSQVEGAIWEQRMFAQVSAGVAVLGGTTAVLGVFAVLSFMVGLRTREFGLRVAVGARRGDILHLVLRQAVGITLTGLAVGLPAALWTTRLIARFLFGISAFDPWTLSLAPPALLFAALLAAFLPARKASRVEPAGVLRHGCNELTRHPL